MDLFQNSQLELPLKDSMQESIQLQSQETISKQRLWDETLQSLDLVADKLGKPIESGIKETCAALMVNGLPTTQSCEGHLDDHGRPYAWVDIGPQYQDFGTDLNKKKDFVSEARTVAIEKADELTKARFQINEVDFGVGEFSLYWDKMFEESLNPTCHQYEEEIQIEEKKLAEIYIQKLNKLFEKYIPLNPLFKYGLFISFSKTNIRIQPLRVETFNKVSDSEKQDILEGTLLEISRITELLKDNFFNN